MKKMVKIDISIPGNTSYLSMIGKIGETVIKELSLSTGNIDSICQSVNMVLTEAVVNAIRYANLAPAEKELHINITASNDELTIKVYDQGEGFNLNALNHNDCPDPLQEHGRGIYIIRSLMDSVEYQKADGNGNVLIMKKALEKGSFIK